MRIDPAAMASALQRFGAPSSHIRTEDFARPGLTFQIGVAPRRIAFEGESRVVWFEGNYCDYEADRRARLGAAADQPHRIKYRHLTR